MGTVKSLTHVKRIVESEEEPVIVVVSALGGITDMLIATARMASKGDTSYLQNYAKIIERHNDVINGMVPKDKLLDVHSVVDPLLEELGYIECSKGFVGRKPRTVFRATKQGREAFKSHIEALENFLKST